MNKGRQIRVKRLHSVKVRFAETVVCHISEWTELKNKRMLIKECRKLRGYHGRG